MAAHGCTPTPHLRATNWPEYRVFISARQRCVDPRCLPWPELSLDRKAFEQAQRELGDSANLREVLARAQQIKSQLSQKEN